MDSEAGRAPAAEGGGDRWTRPAEKSLPPPGNNCRAAALYEPFNRVRATHATDLSIPLSTFMMRFLSRICSRPAGPSPTRAPVMLDRLRFEPLAVLAGEYGSGESTVAEAISIVAGSPPWSGDVDSPATSFTGIGGRLAASGRHLGCQP